MLPFIMVCVSPLCYRYLDSLEHQSLNLKVHVGELKDYSPTTVTNKFHNPFL